MSDCIPCGCRDSLPTKELGIDEWKDEYIKLVIYISTVSRENTKLREVISDAEESARLILGESRALEAENDKLREQLERLQPKDCEGNVLDIADTVNMLRSEYDGDHEWDDVVVELALTKWGGDRWIVRGSKGEAWACDCAKTGYDEDAYESSDDVEPIANPTLIEAENAKLRELVRELMAFVEDDDACEHCGHDAECVEAADGELVLPYEGQCLMLNVFEQRTRELGVEVDG